MRGAQRRFARSKKKSGCTILGWSLYNKVLTGSATSSDKGTCLVEGGG